VRRRGSEPRRAARGGSREHGPSSPEPDHRHDAGVLARTGPAAGVAFVGGALFGLQTRVNGELAERAGSPFWAALVSFGSGLAVLLVVVAAVPRLRRAAARATRNRLPWWTYLGGLAGGTLVVLSSVAVPRVGVATFTVGVVAGQAMGGLVVDRIGLGPGGPQPLSPWRIAGAAIAIVAVAILRLGHGREAAVTGSVLLGLLIAAAVGGAMASAQQALNGRVQRATGEGLLAATVNFSAGTALLVPAFVIAAGTGHGRACRGPRRRGCTPGACWASPTSPRASGRSARSGCCGWGCCWSPGSWPAGWSSTWPAPGGRVRPGLPRTPRSC